MSEAMEMTPWIEILILLLGLILKAVLRRLRSGASPRKTRHRDKRKKPKGFGCCEEGLEETCASRESCCLMHLEKLPLAHRLRIVDRNIQYLARHLDEVLIPPSVTTSAASQFSSMECIPSSSTQSIPSSCLESIPSSLWNHSSFSLGEASVTRSEPLCHTREIMPVADWEGSTHPIQAQPLPRPPVQSRRDRREQITGLDQTSAHGSDFNIQQLLESQLGAPLRSDTSPQRAQEIQEPCVCPSGSLPQKAHKIMASPDAILARLVPTAVVKLQDHVAQKCSEIQMMAFPKMVGESHRNAPLLRETALPGPLRPPREPGKPRTAALPMMGQQPAHPIELHIRRKHLVMQWGLLTLDPQPPAKLPHAVPARGAGVEFTEMETDFVLNEVRENLDCHMQRKKLQQEWGLPDALWKSMQAFLPPVPKLSSLKAKPEVEVVPILGELLFLGRDVKKQLEFHITKMQVQQRWELPMRIQDSLRRFMSPSPEERGRLSHPTCGGIVTPYRSPFQLHSKKARSIQLPLRAPSQRWLEDVHALPTDRRQQMARSCSWKHPGAAASKGKETPDHDSALQTGKQSTSSSCSTRPPAPVEDTTMETGRSEGAAGNQANPDRCTLPAGMDLTQVSAELHGLRDITAPHGFIGTVNSKLSRDQPPVRVCKKCNKVRQKRPAGSAGADLPRIPQRWTPGDSSASSNHNKMPVVWLLPADGRKTQDGMGKTAPTMQPKMVSIATSATGLSQAGEKATGSPDGSPPTPAKASRARTPSPSRNKDPVLKRILMCLKKTLVCLKKNKVKSQTSKDSRSRRPDTKFTKIPFWKARASKGVW